MKNIWALELSLCGEAGTAGQQQHPQHLRTFQRRFHRRNHRHGQGLSLTVWMQENSSSPSERFGLSSLRGSKCSPWGFSEGQGFDWCRDAVPVEVGIIPGGQAGHGWRFWGVATSLGGISSPWHSISGWSSLPAPQHSSILLLDLDCSVFYLHFWLDCWLKGISALQRGAGNQSKSAFYWCYQENVNLLYKVLVYTSGKNSRAKSTWMWALWQWEWEHTEAPKITSRVPMKPNEEAEIMQLW